MTTILFNVLYRNTLGGELDSFKELVNEQIVGLQSVLNLSLEDMTVSFTKEPNPETDVNEIDESGVLLVQTEKKFDLLVDKEEAEEMLDEIYWAFEHADAVLQTDVYEVRN